MTTKELLNQYYNIDNILSIEQTVYGSGDTYIITTIENKYLLKKNCKVEDAEIYELLEKEGLKVNVPKVYRNNIGTVLTENSFILFEFLNGKTLSRFDNLMTVHAIERIRELNNELKTIRSEIKLEVTNDWDRIRDNDYVLYELHDRIHKSNLKDEWKSLIQDCIKYLKENKDILNLANYQLIHLDLGPDNFLVSGEKIVSVLDFSPCYNLELLSLAQFMYWNYFWYEEVFEEERIQDFISYYYENHYTNENQHEFDISILLACLYRVVGLLFDMENRKSVDYSRLVKRIKILEWNLNSLTGD